MPMPIWLTCQNCSETVAVEPLATEETPCPECGHALELPPGYDVFVSYATPDIEVARQVCAALHARTLNYWFASEQIKAGDFFATTIADDLKKSKVVVLVLSEQATASPWVTAEVTTAVSSRMAVLPFKIQQFTLPSQWDLLLSVIQWQEAYRGSIQNEIDVLVSRVEEQLRALSVADSVPQAVSRPEDIEPKAKRGVNPLLSPYVGPQPFTQDKANKFFGRQHDAREILKLIASNRFVLIYAPSGAGKRSLLKTLVYETLVEKGLEVLCGARVGGALPEGAKAALIRNVFTFSVVYGLGGTEKAARPECKGSAKDRPGRRRRRTAWRAFRRRSGRAGTPGIQRPFRRSVRDVGGCDERQLHARPTGRAGHDDLLRKSGGSALLEPAAVLENAGHRLRIPRCRDAPEAARHRSGAAFT